MTDFQKKKLFRFLGVTRNELKYTPRLCKLKKLQDGFGFNLLYSEDRKGEYIENVTQDGPGQLSGKRHKIYINHPEKLCQKHKKISIYRQNIYKVQFYCFVQFVI